MKNEVAAIFRWIGSMLSAYLLLTIGTATLATLLNLPHPLAGSPFVVSTILLGGPISIVFIIPAFVLSLRGAAPTMTKAAVVSLNGLGILCSIASMLWSFALWRMGPLNPG